MYSIEAICDALIATGSAVEHCRTTEEFLRCALHAAGELLDVSCSVFYGANSSPFDHIGTVRVNQRATGELEIPVSLPYAFTDHLRRQSNQIILSADWDALGALLPGFDFGSCSSLWLVVGNDEQVFGTLSFFDHAARRFDRTQQRIACLVSTVMTLGLDFYGNRRGLRSPEAASYHEFSKLVGGVARDLINPLTAIFGYVELLKAEPSGTRSTQLITRIEEQIERARKVVGSFSQTLEWPRQREPVMEDRISRPPLEQPAPVAKPGVLPAPEPIWHDPADHSSAGFRILVVQRSEPVLAFQRSVLMALGAEIISAGSGSEALDLLRTKELDAIVLDDELEETLSSKRLVWWVRENRPELADRMLLTVSRRPSPETREILEVAMLPHVTKPLEVLELYSRAQQMLHAGRTPQLLQ